MKIFRFVLFAGLSLLLPTDGAGAPTATYTFESAQWQAGATTPFFDMAPDTASGLPMFRASFASSPTVGAFSVMTFAVNPSFSGQNLTQPGPFTGNTLTITLNQPIRSVHLDFQAHNPGHLDLTSAGGSASLPIGVPTIGSLDFLGAASFTSFSLTALTDGGSPMPFGIDNLVMVVPEPSALVLGGLGVVTLTILRRRS